MKQAKKNKIVGYIMLIMAFVFIVTFSGCNEDRNMEQDSETIETQKTAESYDIIPLSSKIQELEDGFSAVQFEGNDGFTEFLSQGGASSDLEVVQYLAGSLLSEAGDIEDGMNVSVNPFGCSTISATNSNGDALFGRNFDWYNCDALVVASYPEDGYASFSTVNTDFIKQGAGNMDVLLNMDSLMTRVALYAPLDGMNEKGFCVSVNMIQDSDTINQNTDKPDITTTTAVRLLLNQAADVDEAVALLSEYDLHASFGYMVHLALADNSGKSVVVEYIDQQMAVTETPVVTNFYLTEGDKYGIGTSQSHTRYEVLTELLDQQTTFTPEDMRDALDQVSKHNYHDGETTEWSIVFNQTTGEAAYYHREAYGQAYHFKL